MTWKPSWPRMLVGAFEAGALFSMFLFAIYRGWRFALGGGLFFSLAMLGTIMFIQWRVRRGSGDGLDSP
jgi:hypothetical protein